MVGSFVRCMVHLGAYAAWPRNDILRKHGIIPEKPPSPTPMIEEALEEARRLAYENRLEGKDLDELAELEDDEDEEFLEHYRYGVPRPVQLWLAA